MNVSDVAVELARERGFDARVIGDAARLPFDDDSFDVVSCIEVLEHLFEPQRAATEILRVLKPGGVLIATVPNIAYWRRRAELAIFGRWNPFGDDLSVKESWRDPHIRFFTWWSLGTMLGGVGYKRILVSGYGGIFLREFPGIRQFVSRRPSRIYRRLESVVPALLSTWLYAIAHKPEVRR